MVKRYFTRNGVEVQPYRPLPWPKHNRLEVEHVDSYDRHYVFCQLLPPIPQRFEWVNSDNLIVREEGAHAGALGA